MTPHGIEELPNGQWIVAGDTHLGAWAKQKGTIITDPNLFQWLKPYLENVRTVYDIGANIGDHTRQYLDWGKQVVAIEANPIACECLRHNCPDAHCFNIAASDSEGILPFTQLDNVGASRVTPSGELEVQAMRLDGLFHYDIDRLPMFVKIDVEGWERNVIRGFSKTLRLARPMLFVEFNPGALAANGVTVSGLREEIEHFGFKVEALYPPEATWEDSQFDVLFVPT